MAESSIVESAAQQISDGTIIGSLGYFLAIAAILFVAAAIGAYVGGYFSKRGETSGIKADLKTIIDTQRKTTAATEEVRADIQHRFGEQQRVKALLRDKLEEVFGLMVKLDLWASQAEHEAAGGATFQIAESPVRSIGALVKLYFPEVIAEFAEVEMAYSERNRWGLDLGREVLAAKRERRPADYDSLNPRYSDVLSRCSEAANALGERMIELYAAEIRLDREGTNET